MTIHANTSYQGVHVEKGGIYADNSILAWARILPRGLGVPDVQTSEDTGGTPGGAFTAPAAAVVSESHNIFSFDHTQRGLYKLTLPDEFKNGTKYAVMVTGTNNLHIASSATGGGRIDAVINAGFTEAEYQSRVFRKRNPEGIFRDGDARFVRVGTPGGIQQYHVRVANSSVIMIESRIEAYYATWQATVRHDDDEVFVVVVGAPDKTKFRG